MSVMEKELKLQLILGLIICICIQACGSGSADKPQEREPTTLAEILDGAVNKGVDGIFVYIDQGGRSPVSLAAGIQNRALQQRAEPSTLFKIASVSKLFIAASAVILSETGSVNLDDTLSFWLPEISPRIENSADISLRLLLQHRSGIPDFDSQAGFSWENVHADIDETLEIALDLPADFLPDSRYEYSNTNYILVAKILDKVLGYSHREYIKETILLPLGMNNTYLLSSEIDLTNLSKGYWNNAEQSESIYNIPGGSMISTAEDIGVFLKALNKGLLLTESEQATYNSVYFLNHSGWLPGYQSVARYHPELDATIIQFVNTTGGNSEAIASQTYDELVRSL